MDKTTVTIRLTLDEYNILKKKSKEISRPMSIILRDAILKMK